MRDAIDKYAADKGRYPDSLDDMVKAGYFAPDSARPHHRPARQLVDAASSA